MTETFQVDAAGLNVSYRICFRAAQKVDYQQCVGVLRSPYLFMLQTNSSCQLARMPGLDNPPPLPAPPPTLVHTNTPIAAEQ